MRYIALLFISLFGVFLSKQIWQLHPSMARNDTLRYFFSVSSFLYHAILIDIIDY